jgi:hypothetical protein
MTPTDSTTRLNFLINSPQSEMWKSNPRSPFEVSHFMYLRNSWCRSLTVTVEEVTFGQKRIIPIQCCQFNLILITDNIDKLKLTFTIRTLDPQPAGSHVYSSFFGCCKHCFSVSDFLLFPLSALSLRNSTL